MPTEAQICRANGWQVGDVLEGTESGPGWSRTSRIRITAIGEDSILARLIWQDGQEECGHETTWTLKARPWSRIYASPRPPVPPSPGAQHG
jgi:hypothetical protein